VVIGRGRWSGGLGLELVVVEKGSEFAGRTVDNVAGIRRGDLLPDLGTFSPTRLPRQLRRVLDLGVIKRVTGTYYYLTKAGRAATAAAARLTETVIIPAMV
jgi:hypothetical protein